MFLFNSANCFESIERPLPQASHVYLDGMIDVMRFDWGSYQLKLVMIYG